MITLIIGLVLYFGVLGLDLYIDINKWKKGKSANHQDKGWRRSIALAPSVYLIGWQYILLMIALYWFLFDGLYNIFRNFNWWYTGSEDGKDDAKTDNLLQSLTPLQRKGIKFACILVSALMAYWLLKI